MRINAEGCAFKQGGWSLQVGSGVLSGRLLVIVFGRKAGGIARVITGWDMRVAERRYYASGGS